MSVRNNKGIGLFYSDGYAEECNRISSCLRLWGVRTESRRSMHLRTAGRRRQYTLPLQKYDAFFDSGTEGHASVWERGIRRG